MKLPRLAAVVAALWATQAAAEPFLQTYFQVTLNDPAYQQKVFAKVAKVWKQPATPPALGRKAVVRAFIARDGKLQSATMHMASGSKAWDATACRVKNAAPLDPLPSSFGQPAVEVAFHLSWVK